MQFSKYCMFVNCNIKITEKFAKQCWNAEACEGKHSRDKLQKTGKKKNCLRSRKQLISSFVVLSSNSTPNIYLFYIFHLIFLLSFSWLEILKEIRITLKWNLITINIICNPKCDHIKGSQILNKNMWKLLSFCSCDQKCLVPKWSHFTV